MSAFQDKRYHVYYVASTLATLNMLYIIVVVRWRTQSGDIGGHVAESAKRKHTLKIITSSLDIILCRTQNHGVVNDFSTNCFQNVTIVSK